MDSVSEEDSAPECAVHPLPPRLLRHRPTLLENVAFGLLALGATLFVLHQAVRQHQARHPNAAACERGR